MGIVCVLIRVRDEKKYINIFYSNYIISKFKILRILVNYLEMWLVYVKKRVKRIEIGCLLKWDICR